MKKSFSSLLLILIFATISCQKVETPIPNDSKVDLGIIKEFEDSDKSSKRLLFNILKPAERVYVWKKNLELLQVSGELSGNKNL